MHCANCNSKNIKSRKNYSHGTGSKAKTTYSCGDCKSGSIIQEEKRYFRKRR